MEGRVLCFLRCRGENHTFFEVFPSILTQPMGTNKGNDGNI